MKKKVFNQGVFTLITLSIITIAFAVFMVGCGKKEETLNILGYDDQGEGFVVRPYNELVTTFQILNKVKVNFEIVSSDEMSYENFLLKAASDLNVGKVDLVMGYGSALARLPKSKADLSDVYERHPNIFKAFQYDFIVPIDSFFYVDAYDAKYLSNNNRKSWDHIQEQEAIIKELSSKGMTVTLPMYREYIKHMMYERMIKYENGKFELDKPVYDRVVKEMKSLRDVSGNIDEYSFFSEFSGEDISYVGTPKVRFINGLNLKRILTSTAQFKSVIEVPSGNKYPDVFGVYVRKNTKLTDSFIDYMLSETAVQKRLDWSERPRGCVMSMTDTQMKEKATYLSLDESYLSGYKAIQNYLNNIEPLTREELLTFDMRYSIRKKIFLTCDDENSFTEFENDLAKELEAMSEKMKMVR